MSSPKVLSSSVAASSPSPEILSIVFPPTNDGAVEVFEALSYCDGAIERPRYSMPDVTSMVDL